MKNQTLAAIDIGSNAIRLMVSNVELYRNNNIKRIALLRIPIRLGEDVFSTKTISHKKLELMENAMCGFASLIKAYGIKQYRACATSAMREATNSKYVISKIKEVSNIDIDIISGAEEADLIFAAGKSQAIMEPGKSYLYIDVGGGSTEVIMYSAGKKVSSHSFELGTVRMLSGSVDPNEFNKYEQWIKTQSQTYSPCAIIGSGGNINKIQRLVGKKDKDPFSATELRVLYDTLKSMNYEERIHTLSLNPYRADVILPAANIYNAAAEVGRINNIIVPRLGLADGIILQLAQNLKPTKRTERYALPMGT